MSFYIYALPARVDLYAGAGNGPGADNPLIYFTLQIRSFFLIADGNEAGVFYVHNNTEIVCYLFFLSSGQVLAQTYDHSALWVPTPVIWVIFFHIQKRLIPEQQLL
jgi:hypothetical protein